MRETVEVVRCDVCKAPDALPFIIGIESEPTRQVDLCTEHGKPIRKAYEKGGPLIRRGRARSDRAGAKQHQVKADE